MPINPSVIAGAFGLGSNILTNLGSKKRERDKRFFDMQMEKNRREYDTKMWERMMAYNHPVEQMARLAKAGLNPNLIYGSSPGSAVGNVSSSPTGKAVTGQAPAFSIDNPMVPFMDAKVKQAQANNMNTSAMKNVAQANLGDAQTKKLQGTLSSDIIIAEEGAKQAKIKTFMDDLNKVAATIPGKGLIAKSMAEVDSAILNRNKLELEQSMYKYRDSLYKAGVKPDDPISVRAMASVLGLDLSKKLSKEDAEKIVDFMKDPWSYLTEVLGLK